MQAPFETPSQPSPSEGEGFNPSWFRSPPPLWGEGLGGGLSALRTARPALRKAGVACHAPTEDAEDTDYGELAAILASPGADRAGTACTEMCP